MEEKICLIGSGNLGSTLAIAMQGAGIPIMQVISRNQDNAKALANELSTEYSDDVNAYRKDCNLIILAVPDDAISYISENVHFGERLVLHTAGSVDLNVFNRHSGPFGVFYPLQTFQKNRMPDFSGIPVFVEGNNEKTTQRIENLAGKISTKVFRADSEERLKLHIAAVFACNFTNHLYSIAYDLLESSPYGFEAILPLIKETTDKVLAGGNPHKLQTGPALRNDKKTLEKHTEVLKKNELLSELYKFMSNRIFETKKKYD